MLCPRIFQADGQLHDQFSGIRQLKQRRELRIGDEKSARHEPLSDHHAAESHERDGRDRRRQRDRRDVAQALQNGQVGDGTVGYRTTATTYVAAPSFSQPLAVADAAIALIGPGTGLGVSGLLPAADGRAWVPIRGEGGHVSLAADDEREVAIVQWLVQRFGHASAERALSGPGLCNLYGAVCALNRVDALPLQPAEVVARARAGNDAASAEALALFCAWLGSVAGDLALTLGARGGVYLGGGIVPRIADVIAASRFRERFVAKGRFRPYLEAIPTWLIDARTPPALLGAARALEARA